ncbi:MAG: carboxypeptidase-like regulatory domain-containing protein [Sphingobacteriia bacterium]|nr:MAG: carboxypeptidase-like regulatory domain-containing protein [Sphingobacteriia bacterium]
MRKPLPVLKHRLWLLGFLVLLAMAVQGQGVLPKLSGLVMDKQSDEPLPYVSVYLKKNGRGTLTDSAGGFRWTGLPIALPDTLEIASVGYKVLSIPLALGMDSLPLRIKLEVLPPSGEAVVKVKYNRALWFWRKVMANKFRSDKMNWENYRYEIYNKLELDLNNIKPEKISGNFLVKPLNFVFGFVDSTSEASAFLPVYLTETLSDYYYQQKPERSYEVIKATKANGIENESLVKELGGTYQNVNVLGNLIPVFDKDFISPFHVNAPAYYQFKLADTAYQNGKRLVHLLFFAKRKGENTFDGDCWVYDTSFALQKITLRPASEVNVNFIEGLTLIQEFKKLNDTAWYVYKDRFVADISPIGKRKLGFKGRKTTTYENMVVNDTATLAFIRQAKKPAQIDLAENHAQIADSSWLRLRHEPLSKTEQTVYKVLDTLNKNPTYLFYRDVVEVIAKGTRDVGNVRLGPWYYWLSGNLWEGVRTRFDVYSNKGFSEKWQWGGYLAYGSLDRQLKGKIQVRYLFNKDPWTLLTLSYRNDIDNRQMYYDQLGTDNIFATILRRPGIPFKFQQIEETKAEFFREGHSGLSVGLTASHRRYTALQNLPGVSFFKSTGSNPFLTVETQLRLRYAFGERHYVDNFERTSLGTLFPIVDFKYTKSWPGLMGNTNDYQKIDLTVSDDIKIAPYGYFHYNLFAGKVFGVAPYQMLDILPGNELYYYNRYAFNLMYQFEFLTDRYAGIQLEHNIGSGIFRWFGPSRKFKLRQFWNLKAVVGDLSQANQAYNFVGPHPFRSLNNNTYVEIGTGVDNIFKFFRVDLVWGLAPQANALPSDRRFGVFASYRFNF